MVSLRKRTHHGKVDYYLDFYYRGKRYRPSCKTSDRKTAVAIRAEIERKVARGTFHVDDVQEKNIPLGDFVREYVDTYSKLEKAQGTAEIDERVLGRFAEHVGKTIAMRVITSTQARSYRAYLLNVKKLSRTTVNINFRALRAAWNWAMAGDRRYVDKNIFGEMKELKVDEKVVRFMSQEEIVRLFDVVQASQTRYARRFEIYLRILFLTGGRRTETLMLKVGQLDMEGRYLTFDKTKTDDFRVIPMNEQLQKLLTEYLKQHPELEPESWLFDVRKPTSMSRAFSRYRKKAGLPESITLHSTRHTVGALHRLMGTPLADIRDLFGHKHLTTTNIYTKMLPENLRPVVAKMDLDGLLQRTRDKMKQRQEPTQVVEAQVIETRQLEAPKDPI